MNLTPSAQKALDDVISKHDMVKRTRKLLEDAFRAEVEEKLGPLIKDRNSAIKIADQVGVPRTQIGKALGTSNYKTVQDILENTSLQMAQVSNTQSDAVWLVSEVSDGYQLTINGLGEAKVSGSAVVKLQDGEIEFVSGDGFVIPQIYRNGLAEEVKLALG